MKNSTLALSIASIFPLLGFAESTLSTESGGPYIVFESPEANCVIRNDYPITLGVVDITSGETYGYYFTGSGSYIFEVGSGFASFNVVSGNQPVIVDNLIQLNSSTVANLNADLHMTATSKILGSGDLLKRGSGAIVLSGPNSFEGMTQIEEGTIRAKSYNTLSRFSPVTLSDAPGVLLDLDGFDNTIPGLSGGGENGGNVHLGHGTLTCDNEHATTFHGVISGQGCLKKNGKGTLRLTGCNRHEGGTIINNGAIEGDTRSLRGAISNDSTLFLAQDFDGVFEGIVDGFGSLSKLGLSTVTFTQSQNYKGKTSIEEGVLKAGGLNVFSPFSPHVLARSGEIALDLNGFDNEIGSLSGFGNVHLGSGRLTCGRDKTTTTYRGVISGSGGVTKEGRGALILTGVNCYTGVTQINKGALQAGSANTFSPFSKVVLLDSQKSLLNLNHFNNTIASLSGDGIVFLGSATLRCGSDNTTTQFDGSILGLGSVVKEGSGSFILAGRNDYRGPTIIQNGTLRAGAINAFPFFSHFVVDATLDINGFDNAIGSLSGSGVVHLDSASLETGLNNTTTIFNGTITGLGNLIKMGTGTFTLEGANTYEGFTFVENGVLSAGRANIFHSSSPMILQEGAFLHLHSFNNAIGSLHGAGRVLLGSADLTCGENNFPSAFRGSLSGSGRLIKVGRGTLTLRGFNDYSGGTVIHSGILRGTTVSLQGMIENHGVVEFNQSQDGVYAGNIEGPGSFIKSSTGTVRLSGTNLYSGDTLVLTGVLQAGSTHAFSPHSHMTVNGNLDLNHFDNTIGSLSGSGSVLLTNAQLTCGGTDATTHFSGNVSGLGSLVKEGEGTLSLSGTNSYLGTTKIHAGTLQAGASNAFSPYSAVILRSGSTLDLNCFNNAIGGLSGEGRILLGSGFLTCHINESAIFEGNIEGVGGLIKEGGGTLTFTGSHQYAGGITVLSGVLEGSADSLPNDIINHATVVFNQSANETYAGNITGAGELIKLGVGKLVLSGSNRYVGGTTILSGVLEGMSDSLQGNIINHTELYFNQLHEGSYFGEITGPGSFVKFGNGTLTLHKRSDYTGGTTISEGTLRMGNANILSPASDMVVATGTWDLNGQNQTIQNFSGNGVTNLGSAALTVNIGSPSEYEGMIVGSGSFIKKGSETILFSGTGTKLYEGGTTISEGTLQMGAPFVMPAHGAVVVSSGIFDLNHHDQAIGNFSGNGVTELGSASLFIEQTQNLVYSGIITGDSSSAIHKFGIGELRITGENPDFFGTLTVDLGRHILNGNLSNAHIVIGSGGIFNGNAFVGGVTNSGKISPGNSIGSMSVGSLSLNPSSLLQLEFNDTLQNDQIHVNPGSALLDGAIAVIFYPGVYVDGMSYPFIDTPNGSVMGSFSEVTSNAPELIFSIDYRSQEVALTVLKARGDMFFQLPLEGRALSVASNLIGINNQGNLVTDPDLYAAILQFQGEGAQSVSHALVQMDPSPYTTIEAGFALISPFLAEMFGGKRHKGSCPGCCVCEENKWKLWVNPFFDQINQRSIDGQDFYTANVGGFAIGLERCINEDWSMGIGGAFDHASIHADEGRGESTSNNIYGSLYADRHGEWTHLSMTLLGGYDQISAQRHIHLLSTDSIAKGGYNAGELIGQVSGAFLFGGGEAELNFYTTVTTDTFFQPSFKETNAGGLCLKIDSQISSFLVSELGVLFKSRKTTLTSCWGPDLWGAFVNETILTNGKIKSRFVNQDKPFYTTGIHHGQNLLELGISFSYLMNKGFGFTVTYSPQFGAHILSNRADCRLNWNF